METVNLHLAHRWYLGYDLDEPVPDHSSLSKIRTRYGSDVFQRFFETMVERCVAAGLVWGKELYFDGTKGRANADLDSLEPRLALLSQQHLQQLFPPPPPEPEPPPAPPRTFVEKYNGTRMTTRANPWYQRITDQSVSRTDPDATPMKASNGEAASLGYHTHYVVDGGKARIILAALVTPASVMDNTPMLDLVRWVRFRWQLAPQIAVGDAKYGTGPNLAGLEDDGLRAYIPIPSQSRSDRFYALEHFRYDPQQDVYQCPQGQVLTRQERSEQRQHVVYRARPKVCNACPVKSACTDSQRGHSVVRSFFQDALDRVQGYRTTEAYKKALRKRQVWVEPLFGEGKQWHGMRRFRLRGLDKVNIEGLLRAAGQNIKRLLKGRSWTRPLKRLAALAELAY
jgi:hypothetical protein